MTLGYIWGMDSLFDRHIHGAENHALARQWVVVFTEIRKIGGGLRALQWSCPVWDAY